MPRVALLSLLDRVPVQVDDLVQITKQHLGHLEIHENKTRQTFVLTACVVPLSRRRGVKVSCFVIEFLEGDVGDTQRNPSVR